MSSERWLLALALLVTPCSWAGCADFTRGKPLATDDSAAPDAGSAGGGSAGPSYAADIQALLLDGCEACHSPAGTASDTQLVLTGSAMDDYVSASALVDVDNPDASRLLGKMQGRGHGGGAVYTSTSPQYAAVLRWIDEGAAP